MRWVKRLSILLLLMLLLNIAPGVTRTLTELAVPQGDVDGHKSVGETVALTEQVISLEQVNVRASVRSHGAMDHCSVSLSRSRKNDEIRSPCNPTAIGSAIVLLDQPFGKRFRLKYS